MNLLTPNFLDHHFLHFSNLFQDLIILNFKISSYDEHKPVHDNLTFLDDKDGGRV